MDANQQEVHEADTSAETVPGYKDRHTEPNAENRPSTKVNRRH